MLEPNAKESPPKPVLKVSTEIIKAIFVIAGDKLEAKYFL